MKATHSLILAALVLITCHAYAEGAPHQKPAKSQKAVRVNTPAHTAAPKQATNAAVAVGGSGTVRSNKGDQMHYEEISFGIKETNPPAAGNAGASRIAPANTPDGFQALTKNEKVKGSDSSRTSNPTQKRATEASAPALQQQVQSENR